MAAAGRGSNASAHVPALDGIRGAALACMIFYHSGFAFLPGGIFSVSTFLTLSGYLVGSLLLAEHRRHDRIDLVSFWERRLRRLIPAAALAVVGGVVIGLVLKVPANPLELRWDAVASAGFWTNWRFVLTARSYAQLFASPTPFDHFWSLAIEVQFYLVAPLVMAGALWLGRGRRWVLAVALGAVVVASTVASVLLFRAGADNGRVYYGADTRAAEFAIGALAAVLTAPSGSRARVRRGGPITAVVGFAALGGLVWLERSGSLADAWVYRGGFALNAALTAVVVVAVVRGAAGLSQLLAFRPLARLGEISYAAYLYHWPLFLVLTASRVGVHGWALLGVRMAVVVPLAELSSRFWEAPFRSGRVLPRGAVWRVAPAVTVGLVVVALVATGVAPAPAPAAGEVARSGPHLVGSPAAAAAATADNTYRVTVVGDEGGVTFGDRLATWAAADKRFAVDGVTPWGCAAAGCASWGERWTAQVREHRAGMLVVSANTWDGPALAAGLGDVPPTGGARGPWLVDRLRAAVSAVTATGTVVVWVSVPDPSGSDLKRRLDPDTRALLESFESVFSTTTGARHVALETQYNDLLRASGQPADLAAAVAKLAGPRLAAVAQSTIPGIPRVLVLGDSVARSVGAGLEEWGSDTARASVWDVSRDGCGLLTDGEIQGLYAGTGPMPAECAVAAAHWREQVRDFRPDVVVILSTIWDLSDRKVAGWPRLEHPGDAEFDAYLLARYRAVVDDVTATGARVVWMTAPCANPDSGGLPFGAPKARSAFEASRFDHLNRVLLPQVVAASGGKVALADLAGVACPGGRFLSSIGGVDDARPDGLHFSEAGSRWLADHYAAAWLGLG